MIEINSRTDMQKLNDYFAKALAANMSRFAASGELARLFPNPIIDPKPVTMEDLLPPRNSPKT